MATPAPEGGVFVASKVITGFWNGIIALDISRLHPRTVVVTAGGENLADLPDFHDRMGVKRHA